MWKVRRDFMSSFEWTDFEKRKKNIEWNILTSDLLLHPIDNKEKTYLSTTIRMDRQKNLTNGRNL